VACGPGTLSGRAAALGHAVEALDFSPAMIELLQARRLARVTARVADGQSLPFADGQFDAGFSMFGLMFFPDRARGFAELRRVLRPGGRAAVSSWPPPDTSPVMAALFGSLGEAMRASMGQSGPPLGTQQAPLSSEEMCRGEMGAAFRDVAVHRVAHVQPYDSADALWSSFERTVAPVVLLKKSLGDKWPEVGRAMRAAVARAAGEGPGDLEMTALITVGSA
jgi:SAM-dependent methyltransferase